MSDSGSEPEITPEEAKASPPPPADERVADDALEEGAAQLAPLQPQEGPVPEVDSTLVARVAAAFAPQLDDFKVGILTEVQSFMVGFASELRGLQAQGIQPPNTLQDGTLPAPPLGGSTLEAPAAAAAPPAPVVVHSAPQGAILRAPGAAPPPRPPPGPPPLPPLLPSQVQLMAQPLGDDAAAATAPAAAPPPQPPLVPPPPRPPPPPAQRHELQQQQQPAQRHEQQQQQQPRLLTEPPPPPLPLSPQAQPYVSQQQQQQQLLQQQAMNGGQHVPLMPDSPWARTPLSPAGIARRAVLASRPGLLMPSRGSAGGPAGLDRAASTPLGLPRTPYHYRPPQRHAGDDETLDARAPTLDTRTLSYISRALEKKLPSPFAGNGPVESLLALTEPVDGKSSEDVARGGADFLNEMEKFIQLVHLRPEGRPSDRWIIGQVCTSLTGTAEEWYIRTEANWPTVEAFMQAFADEFIDTSYVVTLQAQLRALTLEGSCGSLLRTYVGRHKRLVAAIRRSTPLNPDGTSRFTDSQAADGLRCGLYDNTQIQSVLRSTFGAVVRDDAYEFVPYSELLAALADYAKEHDKPIIAKRAKSGAPATARATTPMRVNAVLSDNGAPPMLPQADLQVNVIATPVSATSAEQGLFSFECHKCDKVFTHLVKNVNPCRVACNKCKHEFGFNGTKLLTETRMKQPPQGDAPRGGAGGAPNTGGPSSYRQRLAMQKMAGTVAEIHKQPLKQQSALAIHMLKSDNEETRLAATAYLEQQLDSNESGN